MSCPYVILQVKITNFLKLINSWFFVYDMSIAAHTLLFLDLCWTCISVYLSEYWTNFMHKICFTISFISCLYMFWAHVLIIRRSKLHYTASGIITPIGGCLVHGLREDVHETATYRCDDTRGCVMQFWPPDVEHMCSKHVEAWNKTYCETNFVHKVG